MSHDATSWALRDAPVTDPTQVLILVILADHARPNGMSSHPSQATIARQARITIRSVRRNLIALEEAGLIRRGNQRFTAAYRADRRPIVYDLALEIRGLPEQDDADDRAVPPREDVNVPPSDADGGTFETPRGDAGDRHGGTPTSDNPSTNPITTNPKELLVDASASPPSEPYREDVERLCSLLADLRQRNHANGKRPTITDPWRNSCRLLLDKDGWTVEQVEWLMRWCQDPACFWMPNIRSMPKFREKFDQMQEQVMRDRNVKPRGVPTDHTTMAWDLPDSVYEEAYRG